MPKAALRFDRFAAVQEGRGNSVPLLRLRLCRSPPPLLRPLLPLFLAVLGPMIAIPLAALPPEHPLTLSLQHGAIFSRLHETEGKFKRTEAFSSREVCSEGERLSL